jgi:hypothetical protein
MNIRLEQTFTRLVFVLALIGAGWISAFAATFEASAPSFRVHLGVVSAATLRQAPELIDRDKRLHGGALQQPDMQHVLVSVFSTKSGKRIEDATVIAAVQPEGRRSAPTERPLERMRTAGTISYGNFFEMPQAGKYEITVHIYLTRGNGAETVKFDYTKPAE